MPELITDITSNPGFRQFTATLRELLVEPLKARGVHLDTKNGSITPDGKILTLKLECSLLNPDGSVESREASDFRIHCHFRIHCRSFGLQPEDLNKTIQYGGRGLTIIGILPKNSRYPILVREAGGKQLKLPADATARALGRTPLGVTPPRRGRSLADRI